MKPSAMSLNTLVLDGAGAVALQAKREHDRALAMLDLLILQAEQSGSVGEAKARAEIVLGRKL